ncbi:MAG TPA: DUF3500 domain-containing protein [Planctomycetota bacterium]|nr:DUF3500 domain-containing protein [Planctomycetota bacterium]
MKRSLLVCLSTSVLLLALPGCRESDENSREKENAPPAPVQPSKESLERAQKMSKDAEEKGLAEPFKGITTDGKVRSGLFPIRVTGVSTEPVRKAAQKFIASLSEEQKKKTLFAADDVEWRKWMNQHFYIRQGVSFEEMSKEQHEAALKLLKTGLSKKGFELSRDVMRLNHTLAELTGKFGDYGEGRYFLTIMGEPSETKPWGWQLDGHHLIVNYFVLGDQVVMTPSFWGSEPVIARSGKYKGTSILQEEQSKGLELINALNEQQRKKAVLNFSKTGNNNLTEAFKDNVVLDYAGISAKELSAAEREKLISLVALYVNNFSDGHATVKMEEVRKHLDETFFAWIGETKTDSVFYYRIHSPVVLIEYDHQKPIALGDRSGPPGREHIHALIRTPNGNDYGKELLRQHYEKHKHAQPHTH